jgi:hypothetical protein
MEITTEPITMILSVCAPGHLASAIREAAEILGDPLRTARADDPDLFMHALGARAIVYVAEPRLLDGNEVCDPDRMRAVVRACHAPGVQRVVVVFPHGEVWNEEALVLRKTGVAYTILRARALVDELADATNLHAARSVWLPRGKTVDLVSREALAHAIRDGISRDDWCGATIDVPSDRIEIAEAMRRAAEIAGAGVRVHVTSPSVSFAMRKLSLWMGLEPPELEALCDRLGARPNLSAAA